MITIAFTNHDRTMISISIMVICTIALVCMFLYWCIKDGKLSEFLYMPLIFSVVILAIGWLVIFSLPCTGFQMIQFGRQVITPDMCSMINSGVF